MKRLLTLASLALVALLIGCAQLGASAPRTFNEKLLAGYTTVEAVANSASHLRAAGKLSDADRDNVVSTARTAIAGIDVAAQIGKTDPVAGQAKLTATIAVLTALQAYLATKGTP